MIKALTFTFIFISGVLLLSNCEQENANPRSYPRVTTLPVTNISEKGASFRAELYSLGTEKIIDHGFVWGTSDQTMTYSDRIKMGPCDSTGTFQSNVTTSLKKDVKYIVKPFIQTADHIVYGAPVSFKSLGSGAPVILSFEPKSAGWLDTVTINGNNFSWIAGENVVKFNQTQCDVVKSTNTTLKVLVSPELPDFKSILSVDLVGNVAVNTLDTFRFIGPVIKDYFPKQARWGDTITVTGKGFQNNKITLNITATVGGFSATIIEKQNGLIKFIVPSETSEIRNALKLKFLSLVYTLGDELTLLSPVISRISPKEGTWGTVITLFGKFHPIKAKNVISIGGFGAAIVSNSRDSIKVSIPTDLTAHNNLVVNTSAPFSIVSQDTFKLFGPKIESFTPLSGESNSIVTITGNYLLQGYNAPKVKFGSIDCQVFDIRPTQCDFSVPYPCPNGPAIITITVGSQSATFINPYIVKNPVITKVYPLTGTFFDEITLEGQNLMDGSQNPEIYFSNSDVPATIVTASQNKIVVNVSRWADSIPKPITVTHYTNRISAVSVDKFVLSPPAITGISPNTITTAGQEIVISGSNFHPDIARNDLLWDIYPLVITSCSPSQIIATMPPSMPRINGKIILKAGGYKRTFPITNISKSYWGRITVPSTLIWSPGAGYNQVGIDFSINGISYMMDYETGNMTTFNPSNSEFRDLGQFSAFRQHEGMAVAVNRDTAYLITADLGFFRYDIAGNKWILIGPSPSPKINGVAFSLNNKLYFGLTYTYSDYLLGKQLWNFNFNTKTWTSNVTASELDNKSVASSFTIDNKAYVLLADSKLWRFDPLTNNWSEMASYPKPLDWVSTKTTFVINNMAYVGLGSLAWVGYLSNNFFRYDPSTNVWTDFAEMPGGSRYGAISTVINNRAYLGLGILSSGRANDFYEFDPNLH